MAGHCRGSDVRHRVGRDRVYGPHGLAGLPIVSADIVEVAPVYDHTEVTSWRRHTSRTSCLACSGRRRAPPALDRRSGPERLVAEWRLRPRKRLLPRRAQIEEQVLPEPRPSFLGWSITASASLARTMDGRSRRSTSLGSRGSISLASSRRTADRPQDRVGGCQRGDGRAATWRGRSTRHRLLTA